MSNDLQGNESLPGETAGGGKGGESIASTSPIIPQSPKSQTLGAALAYACVGLSVIPVDPKTKKPHPDILPNKGEWKPYQAAIASETVIRSWFSRNGHKPNVGIVCGAVSGGLFCLDFDEPRFYHLWHESACGLDAGLVLQETGKGFHVIGRCPDSGGNLKLAWTQDDGEDTGRRAVIERKAEGGMFVACPSIHETGKQYTIVAGNLADVLTIPQEQYELLLDLARKLDEAPKTRQQLEQEARRAGQSGRNRRAAGTPGTSVIDAFNEAHPVADLLTRYGYLERGARFVRPGGKSASVVILEGKSYHHSANDAMSDGYRHDPFDLFCQYEHGGDVRAAVKAAAAALGLPEPHGGGATASTPEPKEKRPKPTTAEYVGALRGLGYTFRMNMSNDTVEVNGEAVSDGLRAKMRSQMRDIGYWRVNEAEDAWTAHAYDHRFHPVRDYLVGLVWDGKDTINEVARYVKDRDDFFPVFLRRWAIGAVARAYEPRGCQNRTLILEGDQGLGKSYFVRWLASKLVRPELYVEGPVNPDDKDNSIRLTTAWLWEVSELGATTRRSDREALKFFLSRQQVTVRHPYGHFDSVKPALSSFVGTVNDVGGILDDPTGYRRFMAVHVTGIDWGYSTALDPNQFWAQVKALYDSKEPWELHGDELAMARESCAQLEIADPLDDIILRLYEVTGDPTDFAATVDILDALHGAGWRLGSPRGEAMALAATMKRLGIASERRWVGAVRPRGFPGVKRLLTPSTPLPY